MRPLLSAGLALLLPAVALAVAKDPFVATWTGHKGPVFAVAFSPDGKKILSGSFDTDLKLWDVVSGKELATWMGHSDNVRAVNFYQHQGYRILVLKREGSQSSDAQLSVRLEKRLSPYRGSLADDEEE